MSGLTFQQRDTLTFIQAFLADTNGVPPTYDGIKEHLGLRSKSGVARLIDGLIERGYLARTPRKARSLAILRMPGDAPTDFSVLPTDRKALADLAARCIEQLDLIDAAEAALEEGGDEDAEPDSPEPWQVPARSDFCHATAEA